MFDLFQTCFKLTRLFGHQFLFYFRVVFNGDLVVASPDTFKVALGSDAEFVLLASDYINRFSELYVLLTLAIVHEVSFIILLWVQLRDGFHFDIRSIFFFQLRSSSFCLKSTTRTWRRSGDFYIVPSITTNNNVISSSYYQIYKLSNDILTLV